MTRRFQRNRRFLVAILVAAIYRTPGMNPAELWKSLRMIVKAILWRQPRPDLRYRRRMHHCRQCALFFAPLQTCGSPFLQGYEDMGCYCDMTRKAAEPKATCWADDEELDFGWNSKGIT